jgi:hypothetical protein
LDTAAIGKPQEDLLHPYLQALQVAKVPVDQIILQAERLGNTPRELVQIAKLLLPCALAQHSRLVSTCLALGGSRNWKPFVAEARNFGLELIVPLAWPVCGELDSLIVAIGLTRWDGFRRKVLRRLGYPPGLIKHPPSTLNPAGVLPWLEAGMGLISEALELNGFVSSSRHWKQILADALVLRDGQGPRTLTLNHVPWSRGISYYIELHSIRLFRVSRLRELKGLEEFTTLVAVDCPDLESLDAAPPTLVLKDCPGISQIPCNPRSRLLHLERCQQLRSIDTGQYWDPTGCALAFRTVLISECPRLLDLPRQMRVDGRMVLRRMGPIRHWPMDLQVGGDLLLQHCPEIEELPALEVSGSLRVEGVSGLRRLAPGSVIGRHLDLRACEHLEGIPRGVQVGGCLYLPPHLHRQSEAFEDPKLLLEMPQDHYPTLRTLLLGLRFLDLSNPEERRALCDRAEVALDNLKQELRQNPRLEAELLWTASEAWRDLSEEQRAEGQPRYMCWEKFESEDELPLAWFRGVLLGP